MQHFPREKTVLALVALSVILFAFMFLVTTNTITNVSSLETQGVGVYWDRRCTNRVSSISWGNLTPGSVKDIVVYIRNEGAEPMYLIMSTTNWNPSKASDYLTLRWNYTGQRMNPSESIKITLSLSVSRYIQGITNFSFDILVTGSDRLQGDVNGDGNVNVLDMLMVKVILTKIGLGTLTMEEALAQTPYADINIDGQINALDMLTLKIIISRS